MRSKLLVTRKPKTKQLEKSAPIHWSAICRSLYMTGQMKDFSKAERWRVRKLLLSQLELGKAERTARGIYQIKPTLLARLDRFESS